MIVYQNNMVTAMLFRKNFHDLVEKGISVCPLIDSKIFAQEFDFDDWPATHTEEDEISRPYNGSLFDLRYCYRQVFPEEKYAVLTNKEIEMVGKSKIFKVKYTVNLLPMLSEYCLKDPKT